MKDIGQNGDLKHNLDELAEKGMNSFLASNDDVNIEKELDHRLEKLLPEASPSRINIKILGVGIIGILLIIYLLFELLSPQSNNSDEVFAMYYQPFENVITPHERGEDNESDHIKGIMNYYDKGDFFQFLEQTKSLQLSPDVIHTFEIYRAISHIELGHTDKAEDILLELIQSKSHTVDIAQWYLALVYIKDENYDKAKNILKLIAGTDHYRKSDALDLLESMP